MLRTLVFLAASSILAAQDSISVTVTRGTVVKTFVISGTAASQAMPALDFYVASQPPGTVQGAPDALRQLLVSMLAGQLIITPGTPIYTAQQAADAAVKAAQDARKAFSDAALAGGIQ